MSRKRDNEALGRAALKIFAAGLRAVDPHDAVRRALTRDGEELLLTPTSGAQPRRFRLSDFERLVVVGAGKASARMAEAVEALLGDRVSAGLVTVKDGHGAATRTVEIVEAAHPIPDARGEEGARRIVELLAPLDERALVICLISGGGSALLPLPAPGISLAEKQAITSALIAAGADIGEINAVRKHISAIKGGQLARAATPATVINLMLSDVVGDRLDVIGSGPMVPDGSSFGDARAVLQRYDLWRAAAPSIQRRIARGAAGGLPETPTGDDPLFDRCEDAVIAGNAIALDACAAAARAAGWQTLVLASTVEGETRDVARMHGAIAREVRGRGRPVAPPACVISGGETTVTLRGDGRGGRNQEFALAAALEIDGHDGVAVFSGGTDGTAGPTDAAGAIAFSDTVTRAAAAGLDARAHLFANDAYPFFERLGDLVKTGPTQTNVMDVHLILVA